MHLANQTHCCLQKHNLSLATVMDKFTDVYQRHRAVNDTAKVHLLQTNPSREAICSRNTNNQFLCHLRQHGPIKVLYIFSLTHQDAGYLLQNSFMYTNFNFLLNEVYITTHMHTKEKKKSEKKKNGGRLKGTFKNIYGVDFLGLDISI